MQFTLLALPAVFLTSALAAPVLDSVDLDRVVDLDDVSLNALSVDTSTVDGVIEGAWEKKRQLDLDNLLDLDDLDLNVLSVDTSTVDGVIAEASQQTKRQAQPVVDLVHSLLETMAPLAEQIYSALDRLAGTDLGEGVTDLVAEDVSGLLTELVSEIESVVDGLAGAATGSDTEDVAEILGEVLQLVNNLVQDVEGALGGILAIDNLLANLNNVLNSLVLGLGDLVGGLLDTLNLELTQGGLRLTAVRVPVLGGLL